VNQQSLEPVPL